MKILVGSSAQQQGQQQSAIEEMVLTKLKENIEEMVWQLQVTVTNTQSGNTYTLGTWFSHPNPRINFNFGI